MKRIQYRNRPQHGQQQTSKQESCKKPATRRNRRACEQESCAAVKYKEKD